MLKNKLVPFNPVSFDLTIEAETDDTDNYFEVIFTLSSLDPVMVDQEEGAKRITGLWEETCFEVFILNEEKRDYIELNRSYNGNWNAFYFPKAGSPLSEAENITLPLHPNKLGFRLQKKQLPATFWKKNQMRVGITAVIKDQNNVLSYWALAHKDTKPNFHHQESFLLKF